MEVLLLNPRLTFCNMYYTNVSDGSLLAVGSGIPMAESWPEGFKVLQGKKVNPILLPAKLRDYFPREDARYFDSNLYFWKTASETLTLPSLGYQQWQVPAIKRSNKPFKKRRASGEVLMSDYRVGVVSTSRAARLRVPATSEFTTEAVGQSESGWNVGRALIESKFGLQLPPLPFLPGYQEKGFNVLLNWSWVGTTQNPFDLSPDLSLIDYAGFKTQMDPELVTAVLADCHNGVLDILTEALELPETMSFLSGELRKLAMKTCDLEEEARAARKSMSPGKFVKWLSSHWLKGRYALLPILYTIQDTSEVLKQIGREYAEFRQSRDLTEFPFTLPLGYKVVSDHPAKHRCMIKSRYTTESLLADLQRLLQINLAATAWELTTFSFVADWFFNIGDYLEAITGSDGATQSLCSYSVKDTGMYLIGYDSADPALEGLNSTLSTSVYNRTIINPSDHIGLTAGLDLTWKQMIDSLALGTKPAMERMRSLRS